MSGVTLDTGALIAFERNDRKMVGLLARALELGWSLAVPAGVVGQVWSCDRGDHPFADSSATCVGGRYFAASASARRARR